MNSTSLSSIVTGHAEIDRQHVELEHLIAELAAACGKHSGGALADAAQDGPLSEEQVIALVGRLYGLVVDHFYVEERQMHLALTSPRYAAFVNGHLADHAEIVQQLTELTLGLEAQSATHNAAYLHGILERWLGGHAQRYDAPLARLLLEPPPA